MEVEANHASNHKLARYRASAARFWEMAATASHDVAQDVWLRYAAFYQELAARREHHLAKRRRSKKPER
jgi:hypothetical protein